MLCLDCELAGLSLRERRRPPQLIEHVEHEIPTQRLLDHRAVRHTRTSRTNLDPLQDVLIDGERRPNLCSPRLAHFRTVTTACSGPTAASATKWPKRAWRRELGVETPRGVLCAT